jgi:Ras-related protein Rab-43
MKYSASYKICIFGDAGVGKTSLTYRFITNRFIQDTKLTLGVDIVAKDISIDKYRIKLQIWDFGGEDRFKVFLPVYARGSSGGIFMYDLTRKNSLGNITSWINIFKKNLTDEESEIPILGVGGKKDLSEERAITSENSKSLAEKHKLYDLIECSAKTGENIEKIFESITYKMLKNAKLL